MHKITIQYQNGKVREMEVENFAILSCDDDVSIVTEVNPQEEAIMLIALEFHLRKFLCDSAGMDLEDPRSRSLTSDFISAALKKKESEIG